MFQRTVLTLIACSLLVLQAAGVGAAGNQDNGPGCGLGKLAWMDYGGQKQIAPQVMMAPIIHPCELSQTTSRTIVRVSGRSYASSLQHQ